MYRMSPAPMSTPSSANTTPASGCMPANHGQARMLWAYTCGSELNNRGSTPAPPPMTTANATPHTSPMSAMRRASQRA